MRDSEGLSPWYRKSRGEAMFRSDEVEAMLRLYALGWGLKRIASEFGCSRNTVRRYVAADGWVAYSRPRRGGKLAGLDAWLREGFVRHGGNAEVVRQDLRRELSVEVSLRTVERAVRPYRRLLAAEAKATLRFETPPARQLQVDFGELRAEVAGERVRVYLLGRDAGLLASRVCRGVRARAAVVVVSRSGGRVPAFRRRDRGGAGRQCPGAGGAPRRGDPPGRVQ